MGCKCHGIQVECTVAAIQYIRIGIEIFNIQGVDILGFLQHCFTDTAVLPHLTVLTILFSHTIAIVCITVTLKRIGHLLGICHDL